ncbi:MAG: peptidylprolyl isomerase [Archangiaceae bacterium]|nr:peptidylprolyl isomerase [Archangiaceae bacterium]
MKRFTLVFALLAAPAFAELVDRIAAVVNKDVIALSEVEARAAPELQRVRAEPDPKRRTELRDQVIKRSLDSLIGEKLMEAQLRELNIDVSDGEVDLGIEDVKKQNGIDGEQFEKLLMQEGYTMSSYRSFMKKHLARLKLINLKVRSKVKVSDEDLKAEYAKVSKMENEDAEVHARHLLVQVAPKATADQVEAARKKALALADEAKKPGVDFIELAKKKSEGPSAADGGDLGFFRRGVMVPEFERVAFNLPIGGISDPIRTKFGWHVIKVEERRAVAAKGFEELKDQLRNKMLQEQLEKYTNQYVLELRAQAVVEEKL